MCDAPGNTTRLCRFLARALGAYLSLAAAFLPSDAWAKRCVAIVGSNDVHGALMPYDIESRDGRGKVTMGGVVAMSAYIRNLRAHYGQRMLLVDAGDIFQGTLASNMSWGKAMIEAYNQMGYDAAAVGNHEFDFGACPSDVPQKTRAGQITPLPPIHLRTGVLQARIKEANFAFLAANLVDAETGALPAWRNLSASTLVDAGGIKVGIIGASTPTTPQCTKPQNVVGLRFLPAVAPIVREAKALRERGAELVVVVAHMGAHCHNLTDPMDAKSCLSRGRDNELIDVIKAIPKGLVDVVVGGHTHKFMAHWLDDTAVIESGSRGQYINYVEACVDEQTSTPRLNKAQSTIFRPQPLCLTSWRDGRCEARHKAVPIVAPRFLGAAIVPMPNVTRAIKPYVDAVERQAQTPLGAQLHQPLSPLAVAELTAEALRRAVHSDFGLQNKGGVRTPLGPGKLVYKQIYETLPFENMLVQVRLTGRQLRALIGALTYRLPTGDWPALSGLSIEEGDDGLELTDAKGRPLNDAQNYTLSTTDFMTMGGDGADVVLESLDSSAQNITEVNMRDALADLLRDLYPIQESHTELP